ncbi:MAG: hypothetical protein ACREMY_30150, partial [bacterium]
LETTHAGGVGRSQAFDASFTLGDYASRGTEGDEAGTLDPIPSATALRENALDCHPARIPAPHDRC